MKQNEHVVIGDSDFFFLNYHIAKIRETITKKGCFFPEIARAWREHFACDLRVLLPRCPPRGLRLRPALRPTSLPDLVLGLFVLPLPWGVVLPRQRCRLSAARAARAARRRSFCSRAGIAALCGEVALRLLGKWVAGNN